MGSNRGQLLHQATQSSVANSTSSRPRQGPHGRIASVLKRPFTAFAKALSQDSPRLPT